jgi:hypothetical protein
LTKWHGPSIVHKHAFDFVDNDGGGRGKGSGRSGDGGENDNVVDGGFVVFCPLLAGFFAPFTGESFGGSRLPLLVIIPVLLSAIK